MIARLKSWFLALLAYWQGEKAQQQADKDAQLKVADDLAKIDGANDALSDDELRRRITRP